MNAIDSEKAYHPRLVKKLTSQENEIEQLMDRIGTPVTKRSKQQDLPRYLQDLDVD